MFQKNETNPINYQQIIFDYFDLIQPSEQDIYEQVDKLTLLSSPI